MNKDTNRFEKEAINKKEPKLNLDIYFEKIVVKIDLDQ